MDLAGFAVPTLPPRARRRSTGLTRTRPRRAQAQKCPCAQLRRGPAADPVVPNNLFSAESVRDVHLKPFDFSTLNGKVVLISNVASDDTHTEASYSLFARLLETYHDSGLEILAFPSNWYGQKETKTHEEIYNFVKDTYSDKITVMSKTDIEWSQVFALAREYFPGPVVWNFHGTFLFNRLGLPVHRFDLLSTDEYIEEQVSIQLAGGYMASTGEVDIDTGEEEAVEEAGAVLETESPAVAE